MKEARFYKKLKNNLIKCELCYHFCIIDNNNMGVCRSRKNINGHLYSLVYGLPIALNVDPVEKKPLFHFLPGTYTFSLGTLGCNFMCSNCQNWEISQNKIDDEILKKIKFKKPKEIVDMALMNNCQSISYTYNEPTIFTEYAIDIMKLAKKNNLKNIWVSNGYMSKKCLKEIITYLDAVNVDLKYFDNNFYHKNCSAKLEPVLDNLKNLKNNNIHLEITTLVIPGLSDDLKMHKLLCNFIKNELGAQVPWHISKFFGDISWKLKDKKETDERLLNKIYEQGKLAGLKYIYLGNVSETKRENTYCPKCHHLNIERRGYEIKRFDHNGYCAHCGEDLKII